MFCKVSTFAIFKSYSDCVGGSVSRWVGESVVGGSVVGGFNKTRLFTR